MSDEEKDRLAEQLYLAFMEYNREQYRRYLPMWKYTTNSTKEVWRKVAEAAGIWFMGDLRGRESR